MAKLTCASSPNGLLVSQLCCQACLACWHALACAAPVCALLQQVLGFLCRNNVLDIFELRALLEQTNGDMEDSIFVSALHSFVSVPWFG